MTFEFGPAFQQTELPTSVRALDDLGRVLATGAGSNRVEALNDLWLRMRDHAEVELTREAACEYARVYRVTHRAEPPFTRLNPVCPRCGDHATNHPSGACLDRWIHEVFLCKPLEISQQPPPYSATPQERCLDDVIQAEKWACDSNLVLVSAGYAVGQRVAREGKFAKLEILAHAKSLPVAVCRAAMCSPPWGDRQLVMV